MISFKQLGNTLDSIWWLALASGIISILFGGAILLWPGYVLNIFIYIISACTIAASVVSLARSINQIKLRPLWWLSSFWSIIGIVGGIYIIIAPSIMHVAIGILLAVFIILQSFFDLVAASYAAPGQHRVNMLILGIAGLIFGFAALFLPQLTASTMLWLIGAYIFAHGVLSTYYLCQMRRAAHQIINHITSTNPRAANAIEAEVKPLKSHRSK